MLVVVLVVEVEVWPVDFLESLDVNVIGWLRLMSWLSPLWLVEVEVVL